MNGRHELYGVWNQMKQRCSNPNTKSYPAYGGRGIKVCRAWSDSFQAFLDDMGPRPSPQHQIDRKDVNGDYEPSNCRWATRSEQDANRRDTMRLTAGGQTRTLTEWADLLGVDKRHIWARVKTLGWTEERALTEPFRKKRRTCESSA